MGKNSARGKQNGVTPAKLILVGVLSVVLLAVVYVQLGSSLTSPEVATGSLPRRPAPISQTNFPQSTVAPATVEDKKLPTPLAQASSIKTDVSSNWQTANLANVVEHDPFALPASFPQRLKAGADEKLAQEAVKTEDAKAVEAARAEAIKSLQTQFTQLQHQGVLVVMQEHDKYVALVGDRTIHVGDEIDGFTVVAIDALGVRVARDLKQ